RRPLARRALALAPDDEGEVRNLIKLLGRLGDRAGAVQAYEDFARRLRVDFEVEPAPETLATIEAIRTRQVAAVPSPLPLPAPVVAASGSPSPVRSGRRRGVLSGMIVLLALGAFALLGVVARGSGVTERPAQPTAIAVLPFANMSPDGADEYFSDGMTEEIMTALSRVEGLRVAARTSAFAFKGKRESVREIGRQLGVGTVLEGSVRRAGDSLRVTAQLIDADDGYRLWAGTYDRNRSDVFAVQEEIAQAIVAALRVSLSGELGAMVVPPTADLAAYDFYLEGRHALNRRSGASLLEAADYFAQAIARDARFAQAFAGLAAAYVLLPGYNVTGSSEAWPKSRAAAERALALDSTLAEAHTTLAYGRFMFDSDWRGAEQGFRRAIALDPGYPTAHHWYGDFLGGRGDLEGYLQEVRLAHALDPLSRQIGTEVGRALWALRRDDEAVTHLQLLLRADPMFAEAHVTLGRVYLQQGRLADAIGAFQKGVELRDRDALDLAELANAYALAGKRSEARRLLMELEARSRREYVQPTAFAIVHMGLGEDERAFDWLDRAAAEHDGWLAESIFYPTFNPLRSHPRYPLLLQSLGLR
ncbi:MAG TPA: tetratricopeptide repeat protein, partial [Gemmatimonadales bacterium]|nr:tetratricopeptide repeat protein [Gemmatimonadales bacterium]